MKILVNSIKSIELPEWLLALFLTACFIGWLTTDDSLVPVSCRDFFLNYQPLTPSNFSSVPPPMAMSELAPSDETSLYNYTGFSFLTNVSCSDEYLIVVVVISAAGHFLQRQAIRDTWGGFFKLVFLVGVNSDWPANNSLYASEQSQHGDMVIGNFTDAYDLLPYKTIVALKWVVYKCPTARYIMRIDDDVFVHPLRFKQLLRRLSPLGGRNLLLCHAMLSRGRVVHRNLRMSYHVTTGQYRPNYYPRFCQGAAYIFSPDVVFKLYAEAQRRSVPYFVFEDVFVTGLVASRVNVSISEMGYFYKSTVFGDLGTCNFTNHKSLAICSFLNLAPHQMRSMWNKLVRDDVVVPYVSNIARSNDSSRDDHSGSGTNLGVFHYP